MAKGIHSPDFRQELERQRKLLDNMRKDFGGVRERKWKMSEAADASGLKADFEQHYSVLSKAAHNTPSGLASKDDPRILVSSVLRLFHDTVEACACLVFFREHDGGATQPLTKNWAALVEPVSVLTSEFGELSKRLNKLLKEEFGE